MVMKQKNLLELVPQVFEHEQFGSIRVVMIDGKPWFVGIDVARALGYKNSRKALKDHVDDEDKTEYRIVTPSRGAQKMALINKSGVYSLILDSQMPKAKEFRHWVTGEVLVKLDETGSYSVPKKKKKLPTLPPDFFDKAKNDYEKVAMLEQFLEDNNVEYDYELKPKIIEDENGEPALCYSFSLVIKDE